MYPKFIITIDGVLKFGNVYLHKELLPKGHTTCYGGGLWKVDHARSCIILYGRSFDFGLPDLDKIERVDCEGPGGLGYPIFFERHFGDEYLLEPVWPKI